MSELKQGDTAIMTTIRRTTKGLEINIRTHEVVEEFMMSSSGQETTQVDLYGRQWRRINSDEPLYVYELLPSMQGIHMVTPKIGYSLDMPGRGMTNPNNTGGGVRVINMAFLRLVGIGSPEGVSFSVTGVHSDEDVQWMAVAIREASRAIYNQYMKAIQVSIEVQEQLPIRQDILTANDGIPF